MNSQRSNRRVPKTNKNRKRTARDRLAASGKTVVLRSPAADSLIVRLKYVNPDWIFGNSPNLGWSIRFSMNNAYDPNPNLGGGSYTYFTQYAAMYLRYRVLRFRYQVTFINQLSATVLASVVPTKTDLGGNYPTMSELAENPYGKCAAIAPVGGINKHVFSGVIDLKDFSGHTGYLFDDATAALVTGGPAQQFYFNIGANTSVAQTGTSFGVLIKFEIDVDFFDRLHQT